MAAICVLLGAIPGSASQPETNWAQESILENTVEEISESNLEFGQEEAWESDAEPGQEESRESDSEQVTDGELKNEGESATDNQPETETESLTENLSEGIDETETEAVQESGGGMEIIPGDTEESESGNIWESEEGETELTEEAEAEQVLCTCLTDSEDPWEHDWECAVLLDTFLKECTCGYGETDVLEHSEDCAAFLKLMDTCIPADFGVSTYIAALPASGKSVTVSAGWTKAGGGQRFSPDYYPVRFYPGVSTAEFFCFSGNVKQAWFNDEWFYFHPRKSGEGGKFGIIYKKVLYYNNRWHDLKMTVVSYSNQARCDGGVMTESYPIISFSTKSIAHTFYEVLGDYAIKCEILDSETGAADKADIRFQWWDIDGAQRFGLKLLNGSIAARYYYGNSTVNYQTGQSIAGVSGMEMTIGASQNSASDDPKNCVVYELKQCSAYYMGIGFRDNIQDDDNVLSKARTQQYNRELDEGNYSGPFSLLKQTDTSMSVIRTPAPEKTVSNNGDSWAPENTLSAINGEYWYRIRQFVPWQYSNAYYESFVLKDVLHQGVRYVGSLKIIREEDGKDVTGWFTVSSEQNVVMAAAKNETRSSGDFYGYHYQILFKAAMQPERAETVYDANTVNYRVSNMAQLVLKHGQDTSYTTVNSNQAVTKASLKREEQPSPRKGFDENETQVEKQILTDRREIVFSVFQQVPVNGAGFQPVKITMEDILESCFEHVRTEVKLQRQGANRWETLQGWTLQQKGQTVTAEKAFEKEYEGGTLMFRITCRIKRPVDLRSWQVKQEDNAVWAVIPNKAAVTFQWAKGSPDKVTKETNEVKVRLRENHIRLTKEIEGSDIVWDHGNPVFLMKLEGTDADGQYHRWTEVLEFTRQNTDDTKKARLTADFIVPAGIYTASEENVIRYDLREISSVTGGKAEETCAVFDLGSGGDGSAVFSNAKINDEIESHTAFVRNRIGQE